MTGEGAGEIILKKRKKKEKTANEDVTTLNMMIFP